MIPTEAQEAHTLVAYLRTRGYKFTHIPNETGGSLEAKRRAIRMKQQGTSKGFPDYLVIVPEVGLVAIELKRIKGSKVSEEQKEWLNALNACPGITAVIAKGAEEAITVLESIRRK
jgi:hypothetical protein